MSNKSVVVIGLVLLAALLMVVYVPFVAFDMVNPILGYQIERIEQFQADGNASSWHLLTLTTWLVSFLPLLGHNDRLGRYYFVRNCQSVI